VNLSSLAASFLAAWPASSPRIEDDLLYIDGAETADRRIYIGASTVGTGWDVVLSGEEDIEVAGENLSDADAIALTMRAASEPAPVVTGNRWR
jgi:hypothetical protein